MLFITSILLSGFLGSMKEEAKLVRSLGVNKESSLPSCGLFDRLSDIRDYIGTMHLRTVSEFSQDVNRPSSNTKISTPPLRMCQNVPADLSLTSV